MIWVAQTTKIHYNHLHRLKNIMVYPSVSICSFFIRKFPSDDPANNFYPNNMNAKANNGFTPKTLKKVKNFL